MNILDQLKNIFGVTGGTPLTPSFRDNQGNITSTPQIPDRIGVTGNRNPFMSAETAAPTPRLAEIASMKALNDYKQPYQINQAQSPLGLGNTGPLKPLNYRQAEINSMNALGQYDNSLSKNKISAPVTSTGRISAPAPTPTQGAMTYYLDRGDGSPVVPMGTQLPKNMSQGSQPGGGYIFGLNTPAPTNAVARAMQSGLGIKQPDQAKTGPVDPLTRKAYAPVDSTKPDVPARDAMDYGDRTPPLAAKKEFDLPSGEKRGGSIRGPKMAAGGTPCHSGIINMAVGGRTDHIPMNVMEGSYVLPADIVSGLGEGNTMAGSKILDQMMKTGPAGVRLPSFRASPRFPEPTYTPPRQNPYEPPKVAARGGMMSQTTPSRPVPIVAAGGEYVVPPDAVRDLGKGDLNAGHDYLDNFVKYARGHLVKTLSKLPGPKKN